MFEKRQSKNKMTRTKKKKTYYFTKVHQDAIVEYAQTKDLKVRTKLYVGLIEPAFSELVDKIVYTYKFTNLPNIDLYKEECKIWLTTILDKFDPPRMNIIKKETKKSFGKVSGLKFLNGKVRT